MKTKKHHITLDWLLPGYILAVLLALSTSTFAKEENLPGPVVTEPDEPPKPYILIEGDIMVPPDWFESKTAISNNFWPSGIVPYQFDGNTWAAFRTAVVNDMAVWERVADVDFVPRTTQEDYIHIMYDAGENSSFVGPQGGRQDVKLASWGNWVVVCHELCHALGFWHEQSRPDRDTYVQIHWDYIDEDKKHNFDKHSGAFYWGYYDFLSSMHYGQFAFDNGSCGLARCTTITCKSPYQAYQGLIGQRDSLTHMDTLSMMFTYHLGGGWYYIATPADPIPLGGFRHPFATLTSAVGVMPSGSVLWIREHGTYAVDGVYDLPMTIRAPIGDAELLNGGDGIRFGSEGAAVKIYDGGAIDFQ